MKKTMLVLLLVPAFVWGQLVKPGSTGADQAARDSAASAKSLASTKLDSSKAFRWSFGSTAGDSLRFAAGTGISLTKTGHALTITNTGVASTARTVPSYPNDTTQFLRGDSTWAAPTSTSGGDITSVTAGDGLSGGGMTGAVTLTVDSSKYTTVYANSLKAPTSNATFSGITTFSSSLTGRAYLTTGSLSTIASDTIGLAAALALKAPLASPTFTGSPVFTLGSDATGDIWYRAALTGAMTRLAIGSSGYVLSVSAGIPSWRAQDSVGLAAALAAKLPKSSVRDSVNAATTAIQTSSGFLARDSAGVIVNNGPELLAQITMDSSVIATSDTTQMGYCLRASTITSIVLYANGTVSLTPRFLYGSTAIITSPAAFTTARSATTLSSLNNTTPGAGSMLHIVFDSITTKPPKFSAYIYGYRTF